MLCALYDGCQVILSCLPLGALGGGKKATEALTRGARRYHGKEVLALMGVDGREHSEAMCADGEHGGAAQRDACTSECENEGGAEGVYGWCRTDGG
eukprot:3928454-Rhodomonas_salina.2